MKQAARGLCAAALFAVSFTAIAADAPLLWQVRGTQATHYLLGSVHVQPKDRGTLSPDIEAAYAQAKGLTFETDIKAIESPELQRRFQARGHAEKGGLVDEVGPAMAAATQTRLKSIGAPEGLCAPLRAWLCGTFIEVLSFTQQGFSGDEGIDRELHLRAMADGKPERGLETPEQQLELLADLPPDLAREFLQSSLDDANDPSESPNAIYQAWRRGDTAALEKMAAEMQTRYPKLYERILAARNRAWMPTLQNILAQPRSELVIAGALHWVGPDGVIAALRAKGYSVTPVAALQPVAIIQNTPPNAPTQTP